MEEHDVLSPFVAERQALEEMYDGGAPFSALEAEIDQAPFDEDERAALWLAAWARASRYGRYFGEPEKRGQQRLAVVRDSEGS